MPKHILKYKLHGGETPWYIENAGLIVINGWYYGISYDDLVLILNPLEIHQGFGESNRGREG